MEAVAENYQLKWHLFASHLHSCVSSSLSSETFADVSLFTMDGHRILAHRFILSACSQYLHDVLKTHHKLSTTLPILIILPPEINYKTLKTLIQYMYSGEATVSKDILENVLRGGDILKIRGLWRPRGEEEESEKKLIVKLQHHQKSEPVAKSMRHAKEAKTAFAGKQNQKVCTAAAVVPEINAKSKTSADKAQKEQDAVAGKSENENATSTSSLKNASLDGSPAPRARIVDEIPNKLPLSSSDETTTYQMQFLVIKEEPLEWSEVASGEMELVENDLFHTEMTIKPEIFLDSEEQEEEDLYSPLACELCTETFTIPAEWVKHIQTHTDMLPAKRQRRGKASADDDNGSFPPLQCDMCQKYFPTPAEWVHHVQNIHTEMELRQSNKRNPARSMKITGNNSTNSSSGGGVGGGGGGSSKQNGSPLKVCSVCNKKFPSHASMLIHKRTHTGEKPYMCEYCCKGFNVKSNLLRHLRTLHDKIVNSTDVDLLNNKEDESCLTNEEDGSHVR